MSTFSMFQASFDGALRPQTRRRGKAAAFLCVVGAVVVGGGTLLGSLHLASRHFTGLMQPKPMSEVVGSVAVHTPERSCAEQSWPFIEGRCLLDTQSLRRAERNAPTPFLMKAAAEPRKVERKAEQKTALKSQASVAQPPHPQSATTGVATREPEIAAPTVTVRPPVATQAAPVVSSQSRQATSGQSASRPATGSAAANTQQLQPRREAPRRGGLTREQREARVDLRLRAGDPRNPFPRPVGSALSYDSQPPAPQSRGFFSFLR